jgi:hypothetical protein
MEINTYLPNKLLSRQHNETVRRGDHTLKELEYYRGQHQAAMAQLEAAAQESSSLRSKYSDLISDKQRLDRELLELRSGCCTQPVSYVGYGWKELGYSWKDIPSIVQILLILLMVQMCK